MRHSTPPVKISNPNIVGPLEDVALPLHLIPTQDHLALCCGCGNQRTVKLGGKFRPRKYVPEPHVDGSYERFTASLKCAECKTLTTHAIIRKDPWKNFAETLNIAPDMQGGAK